ncbi:TetR/AcrR family transcriptional regulator [Paenibacillus doosanensis]|uniref:TetR/AcrR family transcriptional regulator n=1 Tax=Paenibacillus doosanensis TaxID=1229154 RepID=UPI0021808D0F|nr:TetR/AcrR family transcriptional regulator [Paenibacillus doosanensis]MCS7461263.1 TetR/AcrR family transcriptional regulator [Paenibacillus doosanensis]
MAKSASVSKRDSLQAARREEILEAAVQVFAENGYYGTTTAQIAEKVGISQPYVFKLFKNKEELFVAALERAFQRTLDCFAQVDVPADRLVEEMILRYEQLMETHHHEMVLQVQGQGIKDEPIRLAMRDGLSRVRELVLERFRGANISDPEAEVSLFLANGMLCHVAAVLDMPELKPVHRKDGS